MSNDDAKPNRTSSVFSAIALWTSQQCGRASSFILAFAAIVLWGVTGPVFGFSDTWQLVINTGTTIVTFLMVFLIQNTQNCDMSALHLKLDELIRVNEAAHNKMLDLEDLTEEELERLKKSFVRLAAGGVDEDMLRSAKLDLTRAEEEIGEAKEKMTSATDWAEQR